MVCALIPSSFSFSNSLSFDIIRAAMILHGEVSLYTLPSVDILEGRRKPQSGPRLRRKVCLQPVNFQSVAAVIN